MGINEELSRMLELDFISSDTPWAAVMGTTNSAQLSAKDGILFVTPQTAGFFGCGGMFTTDNWRICDIWEASNANFHSGSNSLSIRISSYYSDNSEGITRGRRSLKISISEYENEPDAARNFVEAFELYRANAIQPAAHDNWNKSLEAEEAGDNLGALRYAQAALRQDPESAAIQLQVGYLLVLQGKSDEALGHLDHAEARNAANKYMLFRLLAGIHLEAEQVDRARPYIKTLLTDNPDDANVLGLAAKMHLATGELKQAEQHAQAAVSADPSDLDFLHTKLEVLLASNRAQEAESVVRKARGMDARDIRFPEAIFWHYSDDNDRKPHYEAMVRQAPDHLLTVRAGVAYTLFTNDIPAAINKARSLITDDYGVDSYIDIFAGLAAFFGHDLELLTRTAGRLQAGPEEGEFRSLGVLYEAAAHLHATPPDFGKTEQLLQRFEQNNEVLREQMEENDMNRLFRSMWATVRGQLHYHRGDDDATAMKRLQEAKYLFESDDGTGESEAPEVQGLLKWIDQMLGALGERMATKRVTQPHGQVQAPDRAAPDSLPGVLQAANSYYDLLASHHDTLTLSRRMSEVLSEFDQPLLVTVVGEFNVGKSTFINALLGEAIAPMDVVPTTATINLLRYGEGKKLRIVFADGNIKEGAIGELEKFAKETADAEGQQVLRSIDHVEIFYPMEALKKINIVDTPGLNALIEEHQKITESFIAKSDAVLWLFRADVAGKESERTQLEFLLNNQKKTIGVVNQIDMVEDEDEVEYVLKNVRDGFGSYLSDVVGISARDALKGKQKGDAQLLGWSNFAQLEELISQRFADQARVIKQEATVGKIGLVHEGVVDAQEAISSDKKRISSRSKELKDSIVEFRKRFEAAHLKEQKSFADDLSRALNDVCQEAAAKHLSRGMVGMMEGDISEMAEKCFQRVSAAFKASKDRSHALVSDFKVGFDGGWKEIVDEFDPSLLRMFDQLRGYYLAKLQDLDDYYESERFFFHGFMKGGTWFSIKYLFKATIEEAVPTKVTSATCAAKALEHLAGIETMMQERFNRRTDQWREECMDQLNSFSMALDELLRKDLDHLNAEVYLPVIHYYQSNIEPLLQQKASMVEQPAAPQQEATERPKKKRRGFLNRMRERVQG